MASDVQIVAGSGKQSEGEKLAAWIKEFELKKV